MLDFSQVTAEAPLPRASRTRELRFAQRVKMRGIDVRWTAAAWSFVSVVLVSLVSLVGLAVLSWSEERVRRVALTFVSFAVGALLGDAFIHLIPEAFRGPGSALPIALLVVAGVLVFFLVEKLLRWRRFPLEVPAGAGAPRVQPVVAINLISDGLHNLIDGLLIGSSYLVSTSLGLSTTIAVVLHEIPQEMGDFGILVHGGLSVRRALVMNFLCALTAVLGTGIALAAGTTVSQFSQLMVPFTAGGFIYIALADLVPELQRQVQTLRGTFGQLLLIAGGVTVMVLLKLVE